jgi:hypothetical protein
MYGVYWPALMPNELVRHEAVLADGTRIAIDPPKQTTDKLPQRATVRPFAGSGAGSAGTLRAPLGTLVGARSGDKGGNANIGVWTETDAAYAWLSRGLTVDKLRELLPETADLRIDRHELPNIRALNFVVHGLLGDGVSAGTRQDPQAKGLGEWLRSRHVNIPLGLIEGA